MSQPRICILDIERMKGAFRREYRGLAISGEFWDLNDYKYIFGRIHADDVTYWPRNICASWQWYGQRRVHFAAEWNKGGAEAMHERLWQVYNDADVVIGHNIDGFDTKKLTAAWGLDLGWTPPSPFRSVDTLKVARREFGAESNTLDALCRRAGLVAKTDRYDHEVARAACAGNRAAQQKLKAYNVGDIAATKTFYELIRPWDKKHPHLGVIRGTEEDCCSNCGSYSIQWRGYATTQLARYPRFQCQDCGRWGRGKSAVNRADSRGVAS